MSNPIPNQGLISRFLFWVSHIRNTAKTKPKKYAPPSPKKIFPFGKFRSKKPTIPPMSERRRINSSPFPLKRAIRLVARRATPPANPLKPSIILIALMIPTLAKSVKGMQI